MRKKSLERFQSFFAQHANNLMKEPLNEEKRKFQKEVLILILSVRNEVILNLIKFERNFFCLGNKVVNFHTSHFWVFFWMKKVNLSSFWFVIFNFFDFGFDSFPWWRTRENQNTWRGKKNRFRKIFNFFLDDFSCCYCFIFFLFCFVVNDF